MTASRSIRAQLEIDNRGWIRGVRHVPSSNCDDRPSGQAIELVIVHGISLPPGEFGGVDVERLFTNSIDTAAHPFFAQLSGMRVSAHFFVGRDGRITQFVSCLDRAWHAGESIWRGRARCNDYSIGIELEGTDSVPYEEVQYQGCNALIQALSGVFPIVDIAGHSDVAPGRKSDPGPFFEWPRISFRRRC